MARMSFENSPRLGGQLVNRSYLDQRAKDRYCCAGFRLSEERRIYRPSAIYTNFSAPFPFDKFPTVQKLTAVLGIKYINVASFNRCI